MVKETGIEIKIKNNSSKQITNVEFTTTENLEVIKIDKIAPREIVKQFLSMRKNKSDGAYLLTFTRSNGERVTNLAGYYTNGGSVNYCVDFRVEKDTTIVKFDRLVY
ncbi:hypothetical protein [Aestuariibaculum suncheonense]|uniref:Uncharacterized protein n=1 Tax=Aestuariibaculum suncheonense TaxID=1028745 RepID=A0A8J6UCS1_9FLAO|nr:hypothetical protein [Aestuariibaculum suncheonense]MBD0836880.1 hypothetical protein [Aestuariibaculum suncheonense]